MHPEFNEKFAELTASLYTLLWFLGASIGPLIGFTLLESIGFLYTSIFFGSFIIIVAVVFLTVSLLKPTH